MNKPMLSKIATWASIPLLTSLLSLPAYAQAGGTSIQSINSFKCVDVYRSSTYLGAQIQQYRCNNTGAQKFHFRDVGNGYIQIYNAVNGLCLDVSGGSTAAGTRVIQWVCHNGDNQKFKRIPVMGGAELLAIKHSGMCLDVNAWSKDDWTPLIQWPCHAGANQQWVYFAE